MEDIEDTELVASEHDRLVSAITKLDKTQHITEPTRNEPTNLNSEFNLVKRSNRLNLGNVAKILENTTHHTLISRKLKKSQDEAKVLSKPLEKPQAERIKRATGYEETKKKVGRWDPVVARSRTIDCITFPLKQVTSKLQPTGEFLSKFELKSNLERELEEVDPPVMEEYEPEENKVFPMTFEEMVEQRQHLAKMRAQQSYTAAKAKRQSKIKSKKYHRVLKKEKLKQQLKEFEELQKKDPEEALKKLEDLEKARALERHTLRHKNTGKWAKNKLIRAKYDKEVRAQLAEQLSLSRSLSKKLQDVESSDEDVENKIISDIRLAQDPLNPWMMQQSGTSKVSDEFDFGYKKFVQNKLADKTKHVADKTEELEVIENMNVSKIKENMNVTKIKENINVPKIKENVNVPKIKENTSSSVKVTPPKAKTVVSTSSWVVETVKETAVDKAADEITSAFDNHETSIAKQVERKLKEIRRNVERLENISRTEKVKAKQKDIKEQDSLEYLKLKGKKTKAIIDEALNETSSRTVEGDNTDITTTKSLPPILKVTDTQDSTKTDIDPTRFIEVKPKYLNTALSQVQNEYDQLDDDEQVVPRVNIEEVFEEDDVVASFRQEKEDEINKDKSDEVNLSLPGWGAWGGKGVKPQKRKRNRFITKPAPKMPRRDENKGDIIIREYKDPKLSVHKVKDVPFPFESVKDYEASIRTPLGNTFVPEKAHKKLIRPSVVTKSGTIIDPMDEDELLSTKNRRFGNKSVIKLLGQK